MSFDGDHVQVKVLRDCAFRLRVSYLLPRVIELDELDELIEGEIHFDEYAKFVEGAEDHFKFRVGEYSIANGAVGGRRLVVTYGKLGAAAEPREREGVEHHLTTLYGPMWREPAGGSTPVP